MGTQINVLRMMENLKARMEKNNGKQIYSLFIDLKSAFDTVDHEKMFQKLRDKKVNTKLVNTIEWIYRQTEIKVGEKTCPILKGII